MKTELRDGRIYRIDDRTDAEVFAALCNWIALRLLTFETAYAHQPGRMISLADEVFEKIAGMVEYKELASRHGDGMSLYHHNHQLILICWPLEQALCVSPNTLLC